MSRRTTFEIADSHLQVDLVARLPARLFLVQGVCMMLLGLAAVALPTISTLAIEFLVGALFFIGGAVRTVSVLRAPHAPGFRWSLATALSATVLGVLFLVGPSQGALTLTMILIAFFILEGIGAIVLALQLRRVLPSWSWTLLSGVVDLILASLIWQGWPGTAAWAIGLLVGVNMIFLGLALTMIGIAIRGASSNSPS
jgi:uncharacterized membrane protein HdeD (DUF308 family)